MHRGCQSVFSRNGEALFEGEWNPRELLSILSSGEPEAWRNRRVLDIGANTGGLSVEIARCGAEIVAAEPDPYKNTMARTAEIIRDLAKTEGLRISMVENDLFSCHLLGRFDIILCLGLIYHFRYPQYLLDYLSSMKPDVLFVSTQTHPSHDLAMYNRRQAGVLPEGHLSDDIILTGWHPTRPLFVRMLEWAGFSNVTSLTDKEYDFPRKPTGATNSAYFRAQCTSPKDPEREKRQFYPR